MGKPREILSPGRTQPEVKKYLHLLLLGGQPGPSPLSLACQEGLQEKTGLLQQPREGQGPAGAIWRRMILFALLHRHWKETRETLSEFYAWLVSGGLCKALGGSQGEQELHIAPCMICICYIFASRPGRLQKRLQWGEEPEDGLSCRSQHGFARQQDGTQLPQPHPCKNLLHAAWPVLEIPRDPPGGKCGAMLFRLSDGPCASAHNASPLI